MNGVDGVAACRGDITDSTRGGNGRGGAHIGDVECVVVEWLPEIECAGDADHVTVSLSAGDPAVEVAAASAPCSDGDAWPTWTSDPAARYASPRMSQVRP